MHVELATVRGSKGEAFGVLGRADLAEEVDVVFVGGLRAQHEVSAKGAVVHRPLALARLRHHDRFVVAEGSAKRAEAREDLVRQLGGERGSLGRRANALLDHVSRPIEPVGLGWKEKAGVLGQPRDHRDGAPWIDPIEDQSERRLEPLGEPLPVAVGPLIERLGHREDEVAVSRQLR